MSSSSVQFFGPDAIIQAFESRGVEAWSIWQNKAFNFKGTGVESFKETIAMLMKSGSTAIYTVKIYEDIDDEKKIKNNTPDDGSFNFKLYESEGGYTDRRVSGYSGNAEESKFNGMMAKIEALNAKFDAMDDPGPDESLGIVGKLLDHPVLGPVIAGMAPTIIETVANLLTGNKQPPITMPPAQLSQPAYRPNMISGVNEDNLINEAIAKLKTHDPNLAAHLQKLVGIAESDPGTFAMILNALN